MIIAFLKFMKLCEEIDVSLLDATNLQPKSDESESDNEETVLFFPALIREARPQEVHGQFAIGWCLECQPKDFFSTRFLHVLLLKLAFHYACPTRATGDKFRRLCSLWINGIHWHNNDGVQTIVEKVETNQCVIMLMSCTPGATEDMITLHCDLVKKITSLQEEYCPVLRCTEYLLEPSELHYPFDQPVATLTRYSMEQVLFCASEQNTTVVSNNDGLKAHLMSELLVLSPMKYLSIRLQQQPTREPPPKLREYMGKGNNM